MYKIAEKFKAILIECDKCDKPETIEAGLSTVLAELDKRGWRLLFGEVYCPECIKGVDMDKVAEQYHSLAAACFEGLSPKEIQAITEPETEEEASRWIPVTEPWPDNGTEVLVCQPDGTRCIAWHIYGQWWTRAGDDTEVISVTHWQPLPDPQQQEGE